MDEYPQSSITDISLLQDAPLMIWQSSLRLAQLAVESILLVPSKAMLLSEFNTCQPLLFFMGLHLGKLLFPELSHPQAYQLLRHHCSSTWNHHWRWPHPRWKWHNPRGGKGKQCTPTLMDIRNFFYGDCWPQDQVAKTPLLNDPENSIGSIIPKQLSTFLTNVFSVKCLQNSKSSADCLAALNIILPYGKPNNA